MRRNAKTLRPSALSVALCASLAAPPWADSISFDSFATGMPVKQADGLIWTARRGAHEVVRMD